MEWQPEQLYNGFFIEDPVGNNSFSFEQRLQKSIWVAPLIKGSMDDLKVGDKPAFVEVEDGQEKSFPGLENFIATTFKEKPQYIFDNHNHAFFFWAYESFSKNYKLPLNLVHIDQHSDMREPQEWLTAADLKNPQKVFDYTNYHLNVGNFIKPAQKAGLIGEVQQITSSKALEIEPRAPFILDIDMDFFVAELDYIPFKKKVNFIQRMIPKALFITVASSPFFINQKKALDLLKEIVQ